MVSSSSLQKFCEKHSLDSAACAMLYGLEPCLQVNVMENFAPSQDTKNVSKLFMKFSTTRSVPWNATQEIKNAIAGNSRESKSEKHVVPPPPPPPSRGSGASTQIGLDANSVVVPPPPSVVMDLPKNTDEHTLPTKDLAESCGGAIVSNLIADVNAKDNAIEGILNRLVKSETNNIELRKLASRRKVNMKTDKKKFDKAASRCGRKASTLATIRKSVCKECTDNIAKLVNVDSSSSDFSVSSTSDSSN